MKGPRAHAKLPAQRYRMPAEWEPHESTWLAWPHFRGDWPGKFGPIPWVYAEIVRNLARHERVDLIVNDAGSEKRAHAVLRKRMLSITMFAFIVGAPIAYGPATRAASSSLRPPMNQTIKPIPPWSLSIFSSMPGPSIRIISSTKKSENAWQRPPARASCSH